MNNTEKIIGDYFGGFAASVAQSRALISVEDGLKPSLRQAMYANYTDKYVGKKKKAKFLKLIGSASRFCWHGDSSTYSAIIRCAKPFAMRYPLYGAQGSFGTQMQADNHAASRYCLTGGMRIATNKGLIPIKELAPEKSQDHNCVELLVKSIDDINSSHIYFNAGEQECIKIVLENSMFLEGSEDHRILTLDDNFDYQWKTLKELQINDLVLVDLNTHSALFGSHGDLAEARAFGVLISEGYLGENKCSASNQDINMINPVFEFFTRFKNATYGQKPGLQYREQDKCYVTECGQKDLLAFVEQEIGFVKSADKCIPERVWRGTKEYQKEFLRYLFEGDGSVSCQERGRSITYSSISKRLIEELQILLAMSFGIFSYPTYQKNRAEIKLNITGEHLIRFAQRIGFLSDRKNAILLQCTTKNLEIRSNKSYRSQKYNIFPMLRSYIGKRYQIHFPHLSKNALGYSQDSVGLEKIRSQISELDYNKIKYIVDNFALVKITSKERTGVQTVYSPRVESKCHSFAANGFFNHNCEGYISDIGATLFSRIDENTIDEWRDNYDNTELYPQLLPSLGFWNLCNGTTGIGAGLASSVPQFNLVDMNEALIELIQTGDVKELPLPDFATGGYLLNTSEVKESLKNGKGASCKIRSKINYNEKEKKFTIVELPYATYTNTICSQLEELIEQGDSGIKKFLDLTGTEPNIEIQLEPDADHNQVLSLLYAKTSLQNNFGVNLVMLENGRYPRNFTLLEAMQAHVDHERKCYTRSFEFQLRKIMDRMHILKGYILACAHIEEVIQIIKNSQDKKDAVTNLTNSFELSILQAEAILKLTLSRIASLEAKKFQEEYNTLSIKVEEIQAILNDRRLLDAEIIKGLKEVARKFGDKRRTVLLNVEEEQANKIHYFTSEGKVGLSLPKQGLVIGTLPASVPYFVVTRKGMVHRSDEQPKRLKKVFNLLKDDTVIAVFEDNNEHFLTFIDDEKHFRCKEVSSLNKTKTTLSLTNIKEVYCTPERTTKSNYKSIVGRR